MEHGGNIFQIERRYSIDKKELLDFSANINPLGVPKTLINIIKKSTEDLQYYPDADYYELKSAIAQYYDVEKEHIFIGNGAVQVIFDAISAIQPKKAIILTPTFNEYERALKSVGCNIIRYPLKEEEDFILNIEGFMETIDDEVDLVILCNPNNPTSVLMELEDIRKILSKCREKQAYLMLDEAFMDFIPNQKAYSMMKDYRLADEVIIIRAFTKFYGIPGLRLGFGLSSNKALLKALHERTLPWSLNTFAGYFGQVLMSEEEYVQLTQQWMLQERKRFVEALHKVDGIKVFKPSANFILIKILKPNINAAILKKRLLKNNILIRDCSNFNNLSDRFIRIAIKSPKINDIFVKELNKAMEN